MTRGHTSPAAECSAAGESYYAEAHALLGPQRKAPLPARRQMELLALARKGRLVFSKLPIDELDAIDATSGLGAKLTDALLDFDEGRRR